LGSILDSVVEYADFFAIENFYATFGPEWQLFKIKAPVLVSEKATASADASTFYGFSFTFATVFAVINRLKDSVREMNFCAFYVTQLARGLYVRIVENICRTIHEKPRS
jgi:hypothetical protein